MVTPRTNKKFARCRTKNLAKIECSGPLLDSAGLWPIRGIPRRTGGKEADINAVADRLCCLSPKHPPFPLRMQGRTPRRNPFGRDSPAKNP